MATERNGKARKPKPAARGAGESEAAPSRSSARVRRAADGARRAEGKPRGREAELLKAAAKIFSQRGYADATVQDVADALGILKGSLYYYIDTKEDLLYRLLDQVHNDVDELMAEMHQLDDRPPLERLEQYVRRQTEYNVRNLEEITIYYHDLEGLSGERRKRIAARRRAHESYVVGLIEEAQAEGAANPSLDPRLLSNCVFATIIWTYRWYQPRGRYKAEDVIDACARFALGGVIGTPAGGAPEGSAPESGAPASGTATGGAPRRRAPAKRVKRS